MENYVYIKNHLGSIRVVANLNGNAMQRTDYDPFGIIMPGSFHQEYQPYKFGDKEQESMFGLGLYDFAARQMDPVTTRFLTGDPLAEKYPWISPYTYCLNNPVRFIDPDGRDPGDFFKTKDAAAKDWGNYYNGASIQRGNEFASTIYKIKVDGQTGYTYSVANEGGVDHVKRSEAPNGKPAEAIIHSHGEYVNGYVNNDFSNNDKWNSYNMGVDSYVATPDGSLKKYDPYTTKTDVVTTNLPSDPKDPDRKNEKAPVDIPKEKEYQKQNTPEKKKEEYENSYNNR